MACHNDFAAPLPPAPGHHVKNRDDPFGAGSCTMCHGADLNGDMGPSCFNCHGQMWPDPDFAPLAEVNDPVVTDVAVQIIEDTEPPGEDAWEVKIPYLFANLTVEFEKLDGQVLLVETTHPGGEVDFGIGVEFDGVIFWMDASGVIFFGNINRTAATMRGIVFDYNGAGSIWFAEPL